MHPCTRLKTQDKANQTAKTFGARIFASSFGHAHRIFSHLVWISLYTGPKLRGIQDVNLKTTASAAALTHPAKRRFRGGSPAYEKQSLLRAIRAFVARSQMRIRLSCGLNPLNLLFLFVVLSRTPVAILRGLGYVGVPQIGGPPISISVHILKVLGVP